MPWVDKNRCTGCGMCVEECPADTIYLENETANIDMEGCIRCGRCHDICQEKAVRHDSEKIPSEVEGNIARALANMNLCVRYFGDEEEGRKCLMRTMKYFSKEKKVIETTLERLQALHEEQSEGG